MKLQKASNQVNQGRECWVSVGAHDGGKSVGCLIRELLFRNFCTGNPMWGNYNEITPNREQNFPVCYCVVLGGCNF